ncbi:Uncharacterized protein BM_BM457, partial [Brugia malayi]
QIGPFYTKHNSSIIHFRTRMRLLLLRRTWLYVTRVR